MKRYLLGMLVMAVFVAAGYSQKSEAAACSTIVGTGTGGQLTYADLISAGACTIDDKIFGDFQVAGDMTAGNIQVSLVEQPGLDGFIFQFGLTANSGQTVDFALRYDVECAVTLDCITSAHLAITGAVSGGGSVSVGETLCLNDTYASCLNGSTSMSASIPGSTSASLTFDPGLSLLGYIKDINASCAGLQGCVASVSVLTNTVDQTTPEPATVLLLGAGLAGLGLFRRRKTS